MREEESSPLGEDEDEDVAKSLAVSWRRSLRIPISIGTSVIAILHKTQSKSLFEPSAQRAPLAFSPLPRSRFRNLSSSSSFKLIAWRFFYAESSMHVMITHFLAFTSLLILFIRCAICESWLQRVADYRLGIWSLFYGEKFWMTVKMKMMYMCGSIMAVYLRYSADCVILRSVVSFVFELLFCLLGLQRYLKFCVLILWIEKNEVFLGFGMPKTKSRNLDLEVFFCFLFSKFFLVSFQFLYHGFHFF